MPRELQLPPYSAGKAENSSADRKWLRAIDPGQKLGWWWDGATSQRDSQLQEVWAEGNQGREEKDGLVTRRPFAPTAPEQNPGEDLGLAGTKPLRRQFAKNKTFAQVKEAFGSFVKTFWLTSITFQWYAPQLQII